MPSNYTPLYTPYTMPDATDAPDVVTHLKNHASRMVSHGMRTRWNAETRVEGASAGAANLTAGYEGSIANVSSSAFPTGTYAPRGVAMVWGFAVFGTLDVSAGYVGITNDTDGGSWLVKTRWHTEDTGDSLFILPVFACDYFAESTTPGWSLYITNDPGSTTLRLRNAQITTQMFPVNG